MSDLETARFIITLAAIAGAVFLAKDGKEGWGWLIFLAFMVRP